MVPMSDSLRPTENVKEGATEIKQQAIDALPWLASFKCPECGGYCNQTMAYSVDTAAFDEGATPAWECTECDKQFYREESELAFDPFDL